MDSMRPCSTASSKRLVPPSESQSYVKRPKRSPETPWQIKSETTINDLPDVALVQILSRLPHNKIVSQCKCVCTRWLSLISDEQFQCRFLLLQSRQNGNLAPIGRTLIFRDPKDKREFLILPELELPIFKSHNFSLRFLPCFEEPEYIETDDDEEPIVVGMHNDLVLCCATMSFQRDYYICNPYTKQYVQIPPSPRCHQDVRVGFICEPYYNEKVYPRRESNIQVDVDFRFAIVRIAPTLSDQYCSVSKFHVEIFSSETGRWTQCIVNSLRYFCLDSLDRSGGIACNGMLYWWSAHNDFIIGLDPYYYSSNKYCKSAFFHSIDVPMLETPQRSISHLSVCQGGRLRFCRLMHDIAIPSICVWDLKDDEGGKQWCNLTGNISLSSMVFQCPPDHDDHQWGHQLLNSLKVLAFDPNNEDILYLQLCDRIVTCNISETKLIETIPYKSVVRYGRGVFPFVIPRWPTPLPKLELGDTKLPLAKLKLAQTLELPETTWSGKSKTSIDDIPDSLLVEILCRLPNNKFVFQCKCVSKLWSSLISDDRFSGRFLWLQIHNRKSVPMGRTLIFRDARDKRDFFILPELELPLFKTQHCSLRFLPCFTPLEETAEYIKTDDDEPIVVGACNDLVLCCETTFLQSDYYICNPYTKQFVRLPPTPRCYRDVRVGFICDPYYKDDVHDQKEESTSRKSGTIQVDNDFRFAVVRICSNFPVHIQVEFDINIEIFSSVTGKWTELVITPEEGFTLNNLNRSGGIAHNGMLYWLSSRGRFIVGLDPYCSSSKSNSTEYSCFDFIDLYGIPETEREELPLLSVNQGGHLQLCHFFYPLRSDTVTYMSVWELKPDDQGGRKWCNLAGNNWIVSEILIGAMIEECGYYSMTMLRESISVLAFDPNDDDILYIELFSNILAFNIREGKLTRRHESTIGFGKAGIFPFVLPKWPTPLPRLRLE